MKKYNQNEVYTQQILNPLTYGVVSRPIAYTHDIFIDKELVQPLDWRLELDTIRNASPNDIVNLRINCPGGSDMVMGAFVKAIAECQGHVVGHIEHTCASAATIIFLACHEFIVSDDAEFMVHTSSLGYGGKQNNFNEYAIFVNKSNERLMRKYYEGFLSPEEIDRTLKGADLWMNSEEVIERLQKKIEKETKDEHKPLTLESAMKMSKEELISKLFPEDESVDTEEKCEEEVQVDMIHEWSEFIILYKFDGDIFFEVMGIEFNLTQQPVSPKEFLEFGEFDLDELQSICSEMNIQYSGNNNKTQLASKILKEVDSKIPTE